MLTYIPVSFLISFKKRAKLLNILEYLIALKRVRVSGSRSGLVT